MSGFTLISYPSQKNDSLLSLTDTRSKYMLPVGGRFRIVDFIIRNAASSGIKDTLIFNNVADNLQQYTDLYSADASPETTDKIRVKEFNPSDIKTILNAVTETESTYFILYNGDIPTIMNFSHVLEKFRASRKKALLIKLRMNHKASMAHRVVIADRRTLLSQIKKTGREKNRSLNIFETIINSLMHRGINSTIMDALYWPINSIDEYFSLNRRMIWDNELAGILHGDRLLKSKIRADRYAFLDERGAIKNSFISDCCYINGRVENCIIFPGVDIGENAIVRDSIILPFVKIGPGARVTNALIDESTETQPGKFNIGRNSKIGNDEFSNRGNDFNEQLQSTLTIIGKNNYIKDDVIIGAGCYISSGKAEEYFMTKSRLYDGESV